MTPIQFLAVNSWWFVGLAIVSVICFSFRDFIRDKRIDNFSEIEWLGRPTFYISYTKPFKLVWYYVWHGFYLILSLFTKIPFMLTFVLLALVSMFGAK